MGEEREDSRSLILWDRTGKNASGKGHEPRGSSGGQERRGAGPGSSVGCPGHRPPPGLYYESTLWPVDIALAIRESDLILVPSLRPDWNSDVLREPTPCLPASALPVLLLLPEISSIPNPQWHIFKFYPYSKKSHFSVDPSIPSLRMERNGNFGF